MKYGLLDAGDTVEPGDEYWSEGMGLWDEITPNIIHWWGPDRKKDNHGLPVRRRIKAPKDAEAKIRQQAVSMAGSPQFGTTEHFWDCECESGYIHPKTLKQCPKCQACHSDQPDSRVAEVILYLLGK